MLRAKAPALVISFASAVDAMQVEKHCRAEGLPGRLIPVPREITAGCGLAWKAAPEDREAILASLEGAGIFWQGTYTIDL
ncbi:DUF3343 domain-containing protein [Enorma burkinafasonensis]|uniref:DUF3343 domain-containing protein n=1 Tax=Enorma burkinafasonensis TaxID=2590867 RepID=UPI00164383DA|nr:DUF3343 domain-containing protein [Enorma burkinafasonensis]